MKKLYGAMLVLCVIGLLTLSSGVALGIKGVDTNATQNLADAAGANATGSMTNSAVTDTSVTPVVTDTSVTPVVTDTSVMPVTTTEQVTETTTPIPISTPKSPGFEMVLTIGALSAIYIFGKFGKRR